MEAGNGTSPEAEPDLRRRGIAMTNAAPSLPTFLAERVAYWAEVRPDAEAISFGDRRWSWAEFSGRIRRVAGGLATLGIGADGRVAFLDKNHPACAEVTFAAGALGAANAVVNWRYAGDELVYVLNDSGATVLFVGAEIVPNVQKVRDQLTALERVVVVGSHGGTEDEYEQLVAGATPCGPRADVDDDDPTLVIYSSGTTGRPKGVLLTHRSMVAHTTNLQAEFRFSDGDRNLVAMPMFHVGGSSYLLLGVDNGVPTTMTREADAASLLGAIADGCTHAFLVPAVIAGFLAADEEHRRALGGLRYLGYGASPMPAPQLRAAMETWPHLLLIQVYGMTELAGVISTLSPEAHRDESRPERLASAGTLLPGAEVRVVDPATGQDAGPGEPGEFWFRSAQAMAGYLGQPEASAETIVAGGWLRSGDVGRIDDGGFLFISDRVKDMIITGGENVYSPEVERVLAELPSVGEVAVIGVPDDRWGESVKAVVVPAPGREVDPDALIEAAREKLAAFKCPRSVDVVDELPRNPTGKILKKELRRPYWEHRDRQV
jgi:acyl-CoA synthetase (AMP-forming)/AMP-acid ligase II